MAKRSQHAESEGQDGRSERPATWHGQPRTGARHVAPESQRTHERACPDDPRGSPSLLFPSDGRARHAGSQTRVTDSVPTADEGGGCKRQTQRVSPFLRNHFAIIAKPFRHSCETISKRLRNSVGNSPRMRGCVRGKKAWPIVRKALREITLRFVSWVASRAASQFL